MHSPVHRNHGRSPDHFDGLGRLLTHIADSSAQTRSCIGLVSASSSSHGPQVSPPQSASLSPPFLMPSSQVGSGTSTHDRHRPLDIHPHYGFPSHDVQRVRASTDTLVKGIIALVLYCEGPCVLIGWLSLASANPIRRRALRTPPKAAIGWHTSGRT